MQLKRGILMLAAAIAAGCGSGGGDGENDATPAQAPAGLEKPAGKVEVVAFKGGYGLDFYEQAAKEFEAKYPGTTISVTGNPRVWEELQPRLVAGNAPDLMYPGWGMDHWALAEEGQLMLLDKALDSTAADGKTTWRDTFEPEILKLGQKDGAQYVLPYFFSLWGWWYDPVVFERNGWEPPKTYPELLALCEKIKAKGIAPITFQGQYPYYMLQGMVLPWAQSIGGIEVVDAIQNLEPGAWQHPAVLQSVRMIAELRDKGFFQEGAVGLDHTTSQSNFLSGKAAMIPCGTWLESEMKNVMPPNARLRYMLAPAVPGGSGDPTAVVIEIEPWMVPSKAKNADGAVAFFKYMTSPEKARQFVEKKATLMSIRGSDQGELPETLRVPARVFKESRTVWSYVARQWYQGMEKEIEGAMTSLLNRQLTPEEFCKRAEAAAEATREDNGIAKHRLSPRS